MLSIYYEKNIADISSINLHQTPQTFVIVPTVSKHPTIYVRPDITFQGGEAKALPKCLDVLIINKKLIDEFGLHKLAKLYHIAKPTNSTKLHNACPTHPSELRDILAKKLYNHPNAALHFVEEYEYVEAAKKHHLDLCNTFILHINKKGINISSIYVAEEILRRISCAQLDETSIHSASQIEKICTDTLVVIPEEYWVSIREVLLYILLGYLVIPGNLEVYRGVPEISDPTKRIARVVYMIHYALETNQSAMVPSILELIPGFTIMHTLGRYTYPDHPKIDQVWDDIFYLVLEHSMPNIEIELDGVECSLPLLYVFVLMHTYPEQCEALWKRYLAPYSIPYMEGMAEVFPLEKLEELRFLSQRYWHAKEHKYILLIAQLFGLQVTVHHNLDLCQHLTYTFQFSLEELKDV